MCVYLLKIMWMIMPPWFSGFASWLIIALDSHVGGSKHSYQPLKFYLIKLILLHLWFISGIMTFIFNRIVHFRMKSQNNWYHCGICYILYINDSVSAVNQTFFFFFFKLNLYLANIKQNWKTVEWVMSFLTLIEKLL